MGHSNLLALVDYFETMNNLYLVTDLALGGNLSDRICRKGSYFEGDAADLIAQIVSAIAYLHDQGIIHEDLKPENVLFRTPVDNADLLISYSNLSTIIDEAHWDIADGDLVYRVSEYRAPEIYKRTDQGKPVDMWAIGVITYFLLCGYTPFDRGTVLKDTEAILTADYSFTPAEYWRSVSTKGREFIGRCLTVNPSTRITAHEALEHPFLKWEDEKGKHH